MPTISRRGLLQAGLVLLALAAAPSGLVEARRRRSKQAADSVGDDKAATQQYDELPPPTPPQWKGKIGTWCLGMGASVVGRQMANSRRRPRGEGVLLV